MATFKISAKISMNVSGSVLRTLQLIKISLNFCFPYISKDSAFFATIQGTNVLSAVPCFGYSFQSNTRTNAETFFKFIFSDSEKRNFFL
jgi:hypothetical protein